MKRYLITLMVIISIYFVATNYFPKVIMNIVNNGESSFTESTKNGEHIFVDATVLYVDNDTRKTFIEEVNYIQVSFIADNGNEYTADATADSNLYEKLQVLKKGDRKQIEVSVGKIVDIIN